jgi:cytochrome c oxidase subunit 4
MSSSHDHASQGHDALDHGHTNYIAIFWVLAALTVTEVAFAEYALGMGFNIPIMRVVLMGMAFVKAAIVGLYYMHLKFEKILLYIVACSPLAFASILFVGTLWDITWYQQFR